MLNKWLSGASALIVPAIALADEAVAAPPPNADPTALILFAVVMVAMIGGFAGYIYLKEKGNKRGAVK